MRAINRKTREAIRGTLETVQGVALAQEWTQDAEGHLDFTYAGETDIWWDEQRSVTRNGKTIYVDEDGNECTEDEIELVPDDEPGE